MKKNLKTVFLLAPLAACAAAPTEPAGDRPAYRADAFVESIGLSAAPFDEGVKWAPELFFDLGVRYYRNVLKYALTNPRQPELMEEWFVKTGARPMFLLDPGCALTIKADWRGVKEDGNFKAMLDEMERYAPGLVAELESPNELNNKFPPQDLNMKYKGLTDEAAGSRYQRDLYAAMKSRPSTRDIPVVMYSAIFTDFKLARPCDAFDYLNTHSYQGDGIPSSSLCMNFARTQVILPPGGVIKPYVPTECGYNVELDKANGMGYVGSLRAQAYNEPMLLAEYFRHGIRRTYLFSLPNVDGYGLLESDNKTRRPSWYALRTLIALLNDSKWDGAARRRTGGASFTPRALRFAVENAPDTVHTLTLQKENGDWYLLVWNEVRNRRGGKDVTNPPVDATIRFLSGAALECTGHWRQGEIPEKVYETPDGAAQGGFAKAPVPRVENGAVAVSVPSRLTVYRFREKGAAAAGPAPAAPVLKTLDAAENAIELGVAMREADKFESVMIFRNDMHCHTVARAGMKARDGRLTARWTDDSAWIRPALGYRYRAVAVARDGRTGPATDIVAQSAERYPDLVALDFDLVRDGSGPLRDGEVVGIRGQLANYGNGATPNPTVGDVDIYNSSISITYTCEGQTLGWGGNDGRKPMAPGEKLDCVAGGPNNGRWRLTPGTHVVRAYVDDVNRVCGEPDEYNNIMLKSFTVGEHPGALSLVSRVAPYQIDLSREGKLDWVCFNSYGENAAPVRKKGANLIRFAGKTGEGYMNVNPGCPLGLNWGADGTAPAGKDVHAGYWGNCVGNGYRLEVPAGKEERTLLIWAGVTEGGKMSLSARLSDGSAPEIKDAAWSSNRANIWSPVPGDVAPVYVLRYRAASDDAKLLVEYKLVEEPNRFRSQIRLQAAALR